MILAAGLGTRLRPLTDLRAKPALPVRGVPVIATLLELLARHDVTEIIVNLHHHADHLRETARAHCPSGVSLAFSEESEPLGTGGGMRRAAGFLRESDPSLVLSGDMLLDADLGALVERHRERGDFATLLLREDPRAESFGSIGLAADGRVRRIGADFDLGGGARAGVFLGVRCLAARAFETLPDRDAFEDLRDWLAPRLAAGARDVRGELWPADRCLWEPVGTPAEYLAANLEPLALSYLDLDVRGRKLGTRIEGDRVVGAGALVGSRTDLQRVVIWDGERVPDDLCARDGVFAGGRFHPCATEGGRRACP